MANRDVETLEEVLLSFAVPRGLLGHEGNSIVVYCVESHGCSRVNHLFLLTFDHLRSEVFHIADKFDKAGSFILSWLF